MLHRQLVCLARGGVANDVDAVGQGSGTDARAQGSLSHTYTVGVVYLNYIIRILGCNVAYGSRGTTHEVE